MTFKFNRGVLDRSARQVSGVAAPRQSHTVVTVTSHPRVEVPKAGKRTDEEPRSGTTGDANLSVSEEWPRAE